MVFSFLSFPLWLLWTRRDSSACAHGSDRAFSGPRSIVLALAFHVVGELGAIWILSQVGFVLDLIGIVLARRRLFASSRGLYSNRLSAVCNSAALFH